MSRNLRLGLAATGFAVLCLYVVGQLYVWGQTSGSVPAEFSPLYKLGIASADVQKVLASLPYDSLSLERTPCFGTCPAYKVTLYRDGRAELHVPKEVFRPSFAPGAGDFSGHVNVFDFGKICHLATLLKLESLSGRHGYFNVDIPVFTVSTTVGSNTRKVSDSGGGPIELWAVQQAIDAVSQRIRWSPKQ